MSRYCTKFLVGLENFYNDIEIHFHFDYEKKALFPKPQALLINKTHNVLRSPQDSSFSISASPRTHFYQNYKVNELN